MSGRAFALALTMALVMPPAASAPPDRTGPPAPGPVRPLRFPPVTRLALGNGLEVRLVPAHAVPVVTALLVVKSGGASDPAGQEGIAATTASMLDEGAGGRDALALEDELSFLGASLSTGASWDASTVALSVPSARLATALPLMADVALRPDFPPKELERLRKESLTSLLLARSDPGRIAQRALAKAVFGDAHRYGRPLGGDAPQIAAFTVEPLRAFHRTHYRPGNASLIVVGDVTQDAVVPLLERTFGAWPAGGSTPPPVAAPPQLKGRTIWLVDKPKAEQSALRIGRVGPPRTAPDHAAVELMNTLLGGSFTSRLNDNLREKKGYTYGAYSRFDFRRSAGVFAAAADVQTRVTAEALGEMLKELRAITAPPRADEADRARSYLALSFPREFETTGDIASRVAEQVVFGLPDDAWDAFVPKVLATDPSAMAKAATRTVDAGRSAIVVVGDRAVVETPLRALAAGPLRILTVDDVFGPAPAVAP